MHASGSLALLVLLQLATLSTSTPIAGTRSSTPTCAFTESYPTAPSCPSSCCGWLFPTSPSSPGDTYCTPSSSLPPLPLSKAAPSGWLSACTALKASLAANPANYVLTTFQQGADHVLAANEGCSVVVNISTPSDPDSPHVGTADAVAFLDAAIGAASTSRGGSAGATGATSCWAYDVQWKVVPAGF